jgi:hypothetical protein
MQSPLLSQKSTVRTGTKILVFPSTPRDGFPSTPPFAQPRKRGAQSVTEMQRRIASYLPQLIEDVRLDIVAAWRREVPIAFLAKMHQLTVRQVEAVIWVEYHQQPCPAPAMSAREAMGMMRRAA